MVRARVRPLLKYSLQSTYVLRSPLTSPQPLSPHRGFSSACIYRQSDRLFPEPTVIHYDIRPVVTPRTTLRGLAYNCGGRGRGRRLGLLPHPKEGTRPTQSTTINQMIASVSAQSIYSALNPFLPAQKRPICLPHMYICI